MPNVKTVKFAEQADRRGFWSLDLKRSYPVGPEIAIPPLGGSYVQTSFRVSSQTITALG
jgi:hypothetical protein